MIDNLFHYRAILTLFLIFVPLERLLPARPGQRIFRRDWMHDLICLLANGLVVRFGLFLVVSALIAGLGAVDPNGFVARQPLWLQVIAAVIVADAGVYGAHRLLHAVPWLWRCHAVHHSSEELDWLAAYRVHPIDQTILGAASYLPLYWLGFSIEAIAAHRIIYLVQSVLIHSNVRIGFGPLRHVLASPRFHHWHHANHAEAHDRNFAPSFTWLDRLFGTLYLPDSLPTRYGTDDPVPTDYLRQIAWPFVRQRRAAPASAVAEASAR